MYRNRIITTTAAAATMLLLGATAPSASARQDPGVVTIATIQTARHQCPLERVGTQYVKCDDLTGNGVLAPAWTPEFSLS